METFYALRFTPYETIYKDVEKVKALLNNYSKCWVLGEEYDNKGVYHYHAVSTYQFKTIDFDNEDVKGNKYFSCPEARDLQKAVSYSIKDGLYHFSESEYWVGGEINMLWNDFVELRFSESFEKPKSYTVQIDTLNNQFQNGDINARELWVEYGKARSYFDLRVNYNQIDELVLGQMIKKDPDLLNFAVRNRKIFS